MTAEVAEEAKVNGEGDKGCLVLLIRDRSFQCSRSPGNYVVIIDHVDTDEMKIKVSWMTFYHCPDGPARVNDELKLAFLGMNARAHLQRTIKTCG
jgi:hypothetical protein